MVPVAFLLRRFTALRHHIDYAAVGVWCLMVPAFVVLFFRAGKASLLPPLPGVSEENFGCCSQGLVFPREQIPGLVEFLRRKEEGQVDMLLKERALEACLARMALYPVQLQHVGTRSVRGTTNIEAQSIWSMAFEELDPQTVSYEHERLVRSIYPTPLNPILIHNSSTSLILRYPTIPKRTSRTIPRTVEPHRILNIIAQILIHRRPISLYQTQPVNLHPGAGRIPRTLQFRHAVCGRGAGHVAPLQVGDLELRGVAVAGAAVVAGALGYGEGGADVDAVGWVLGVCDGVLEKGEVVTYRVKFWKSMLET